MKKKVLILAGYYTPSVKGGGPIQSIKNMVDNLNDYFEFYIVANDRDLGDAKPFENVVLNEWTTVGNANVYYTDINKINSKEIIKIINVVNCDNLYLNSVFSFKLSVLPLLLIKLKKISFNKIIVAPRGGFSQGALGLKKGKKKLLLKISQKINLYKDVVWHATALDEKKDIIKNIGNDNKILIAHNLTKNYDNIIYNKKMHKEIGNLKIAFVSRIHPKKNIMLAIKLLKQVNGMIEFNIYGPIEDEEYWEKCELLIKKMPNNIKVNYKGVLEHNKVINTFSEHHIFLFPTLGENFGHVISEALISGCPVIVSDQTPWRNLEKKGIGWDINLKDELTFIECIQKCVNWDEKIYNEYSERAFEYAKIASNQKKDIDDLIVLLA